MKTNPLFLPVPLPDRIQSVQDQGLAVVHGGVAGVADGGGQGAGDDHRRLRCAEDGAAFGEHAVQHGGGAVQDAAVQAVGGIGAQKTARLGLGVHLGQLRRIAYQGLEAQLRRGQNDAAHDAGSLVHGQQADGGIDVHHKQRRLVAAQGPHDGAEKLSAQLGGVVHPDAHTALQAGPDLHQGHLAHLLQGFPHPGRQRGHHAGQDHVSHIERGRTVQGQHVDHLVDQLVRAEPAVRVQTGGKDQFAVGVVSAEGDVGVADIQCQEHHATLLSFTVFVFIL